MYAEWTCGRRQHGIANLRNEEQHEDQRDAEKRILRSPKALNYLTSEYKETTLIL
jgi:hypothetical protein